MVRAIGGTAAATALLAVLAACSSPTPYRDLAARPAANCADVHCWTSPWEKHENYDLFTVEFDDQGWLAASDRDPALAASQLALVMDRLRELTEGPRPSPLSIVLYTHGWHHSAAPGDGNVVSIRQFLSDTAQVEEALCLAKRKSLGMPAVAGTACRGGENVANHLKVRHVVGIYVGWRGDSILGPLIQHASIWDRKLTAEKVALGSVQELYALLHNFWRQHACHLSSRFDAACVDVRLLTMGHSFGGLITYRGLAPRLMAGVVETYRERDVAGETPYGYGFGDLSVLINPAFEGTRFEALARAASARDYEIGSGRRTAQLPVLVIAQSTGDVATHYFFPLFRYVTTLFESASGVQRQANVDTVGWNPRYVTHKLDLSDAAGGCGSPDERARIEDKLAAEAERSEQLLSRGFRDLDAGEIRFCDGLVLTKVKDGSSSVPLRRPPYLPLWVLQTDTRVIKNHNDFLDPHFLDFVRQVYYTIERGTDHYLLSKAAEAKPR